MDPVAAPLTSGFSRLLLAVAFLALGAAPAAAQEGAIVGQVRDESSGTGLAAVHVEVVESDGSVVATGTTSSSGAFRIGDVPAGTYDVVFTVTGWEMYSESAVEVRAGESTQLDVSMTPRAFTLNPVTVSASREAEKLLDAPAAVEVVTAREIQRTVALTPAEYAEGRAGIDVLRSGLQQSYVVARGFNNVFSGSMLVLNDYRIARVPSLRANIMHLNPTTHLDLETVELVLGPASALYGPNAANGVLHMLTKSPIDQPGHTISVVGGLRGQDSVPPSATGGQAFGGGQEGVAQVAGRFAFRTSDEFGFKVSGQYFSGTDWRYLDPAEVQGRQLAQACLASPAFPSAEPCLAFDPSGSSTTEAFRQKLNRVGNRDFGLERWTIDTRADWRPTDETSVVLSAGWNKAGNSIDLTGIGAAQASNWLYSYYQARVDAGDFFGQFFLNTSDAGDTYILRTGNPIVDRSYVAVGQLQHRFDLGARTRVTYGSDLIFTVPRTEGTVNGRNEDDDNITEVGGYVQTETRLGGGFDLLAAARVDKHSEIDDPVFSPRAGLVYRPAEGHNLRATYNRAFSTPTTNNLFLDISVGNVAGLYGIRAIGSGDGFRFQRVGGVPAMKSPFNPDPTQYLPPTTEVLWQLATGVIASQNPQAGAALQAIAPPTSTEVPPSLMVLNTESQSFEPFGGFGQINEIPAIKEQLTNTLEFGYKGLIRERFLLAADVWFEQREDFVGPLRVETPNVFLDGQALGQYVVPRLTQVFVQQGLPQQVAQQQATQIATSMAQLPLGVIQPQGVSDAPNLMLTYRNFGDVNLWGADVRFEWQVDEMWNVKTAGSVASTDAFETSVAGDSIYLNAPTFKWSGEVGYEDGGGRWDVGLGARFQNSFPFNSGVFIGSVDDFFLMDLGLGYGLPGVPGAELRLNVQNLFDTGYRSVVGGPEMGRFSTLRFQYSF